jgi:hypothetical protein
MASSNTPPRASPATATSKTFNLKAKADYDGNGKVEGVKEEIKGLLNAVWKALEAKGVKKVETGYPYATLPRDAQGNVDDKIDNAFYNFRTVYGVMWGVGADGKPNPGNEGAAQAMHNFKRSCALLQLSLKDWARCPPPRRTAPNSSRVTRTKKDLPEVEL